MSKISHICPNCSGLNVQKLEPPFGDAFFIGTVDTATNEINPIAGYTANIYVCPDCGRLTFTTPTIDK
jgi:predicted RNA-binding Zn-ribbon protein involved in translation (DUF1610 family)